MSNPHERVNFDRVNDIIDEIQLRIPLRENGNQFTYEETLHIASAAAEIALRMAEAPDESVREASRFVRFEETIEDTGIPPMVIGRRGEI